MGTKAKATVKITFCGKMQFCLFRRFLSRTHSGACCSKWSPNGLLRDIFLQALQLKTSQSVISGGHDRFGGHPEGLNEESARLHQSALARLLKTCESNYKLSALKQSLRHWVFHIFLISFFFSRKRSKPTNPQRHWFHTPVNFV